VYKLGKKSKDNLKGVHPDLVAVVMKAIELTTQDFTVFEGLRTADRQAQLYRSGASKTLDSKHLIQKGTGYGHAVDLVPWVDGMARWEWGPIYPIAMAVWDALKAVNDGRYEKGLPAIRLRWGGVWDRSFADLDPAALKREVEAYAARHPGPDFLDGPHFELRI
jgi:peptidoglycan LD-endopeptidase CwlK